MRGEQMDTLETGSVPDFGEDPLKKTETSENSASADGSVDEGRSAAIMAYIPFLCFVPLTTMRDNKFAMHHGRQGLVLLMAELLAVLFLIPKVSNFFWVMVIILCAGSAIAGILFAIQGKAYKLPYIGDIAEKLKL
jgi:uncharacterized membrane protein